MPPLTEQRRRTARQVCAFASPTFVAIAAFDYWLAQQTHPGVLNAVAEHWPPSLPIALLALSLAVITGLGFAWLTLHRWSLWVGQQVRFRKREILNLNWSTFVIQQIATKIRELSIAARTPTTVATVVAFLISLAGFALILFSHSPAPEPPARSSYLTLWQLQFGLGIAALPILTFIIQYGSVGREARQPTVEVLVRYTWIFPILLIVFGFSLVIGSAAKWFWGTNTFAAGFALFSVSVLTTAYAFTQLFRLLYDKSLLEDKSSALLRERFRSSLIDTTDRRIGANIMLERIRELGASYSPILPSASQKGFMNIELDEPGRIVDAHLGQLAELIRLLPREEQEADSTAGSPPAPAKTSQLSSHSIVFRKLFGQAVHESNLTVLWLRKADFEDLDRERIERQLRGALETEPLE